MNKQDKEYKKQLQSFIEQCNESINESKEEIRHYNQIKVFASKRIKLAEEQINSTNISISEAKKTIENLNKKP